MRHLLFFLSLFIVTSSFSQSSFEGWYEGKGEYVSSFPNPKSKSVAERISLGLNPKGTAQIVIGNCYERTIEGKDTSYYENLDCGGANYFGTYEIIKDKVIITFNLNYQAPFVKTTMEGTIKENEITLTGFKLMKKFAYKK